MAHPQLLQSNAGTGSSAGLVLDVRDVSVAFGQTTIVEGVSFTLHAGEVLAVIGPNGAGKSTLLGAVAGDYPYAGSIRLSGTELADWSNQALARERSVLRQSNQVSFPFNVIDVVKMGRAPWRNITSVAEDDRIIAEELVRSDTLKFADRPFTSLSGGERARVSLARAMTQRTRLLMLDEPTAALDINYQEQVLALARQYARKGNAVLVVLHDLAAAAAYSDRVLLLENGRMRHHGTPGEVLTSEVVSDVYRHPVRVFPNPDGSLAILPVRFADEPYVPASRAEEEGQRTS